MAPISPRGTRVLGTLCLGFIACIPVVVYYGVMCRYTVNFPIWDEYEFALHPFRQSFHSRMQPDHLFRFWVDHRLVIPRLVYEAMFQIENEINFRHANYLANLVLLPLLALFALIARRRSMNWIYLAPLPFLLFTLKSWENMTFSQASIGSYLSMFFALSSLYIFQYDRHRSTIFSLGLAVLASYTMASGLVTWGVLLLWSIYDLTTKTSNSDLKISKIHISKFHLVRCFLTGMCASLVFLHYLNGYSSAHDTTLSWNTLWFFFAFLGSVIDLPSVAGMGGLLALAVFSCLACKQYYKKNPVIFAWLLFLLGVAAMTAYGRAALLGLDGAASSRYVIAAALFLCCLYFAITELIVMDKETSFQKRWLGLSLLVVSLLYLVPIRNARAALSTRKAVLEEMACSWAYLGHGPTFSAPGDGGPAIMKTAMALGVFQPDPLKSEHRDSPIPCVWATGFHRPEPRGEHIWHWCGSRGTLVLVNREKNVVNVTLEFHCHSGRPEDISISLESALFSETVNASPKGTRVSHQLELPPGKSTITFSTTADPILAPKDPRELVFGVSRLAVRGGKRL